MPKSSRFFSAQNRREWLLPALFIAPALAVLLFLSIYPLIYSITISLQQETSGGIVWTLGNFTRLVSDNFFLTAMVHTFVYAAAALSCEFLLGLGLALLLNSRMRGRGLFRASLLVPMMLPSVVVGVIWRLMLNPDFGAINGTLKQFGINTESLTWTASPKLAMF
jgi:ABC-type sugar transport system permease subunit